MEDIFSSLTLSPYRYYSCSPFLGSPPFCGAVRVKKIPGRTAGRRKEVGGVKIVNCPVFSCLTLLPKGRRKRGGDCLEKRTVKFLFFVYGKEGKVMKLVFPFFFFLLPYPSLPILFALDPRQPELIWNSKTASASRSMDEGRHSAVFLIAEKSNLHMLSWLEFQNGNM